MIHVLTFDMTSVSGDEHSAHIVLNSKEDAEKVQRYLIENNVVNGSCPFHNFDISPYVPEKSMSFEEWKERWG